MPAIVFKPTPPEWVEIYCLSENNPSALLPYLDDEFLEQKVQGDSQEAKELRSLMRWYAIRRSGDIAPPECIPHLQSYARQCEARATGYDKHRFELMADVAHLTIQRIRLRAKGREVYVKTMIEWVQAPDPPLLAPLRDKQIVWRKVREGARALGVLKAREAVPALMARCDWNRSDPSDNFGFCARALARIGDRQGMEGIKRYLMNFTPYPPEASAIVPLEPGEPDPALAYWQMRTEGMSLEQAVQEIIRTCEREVKVFRHDPPVLYPDGSVVVESRVPANLRYAEILEYIGKPAVPALIKVLEHPDSSVEALGLALRVLPKLQAVEAIPTIRKWLHGPFREDAAFSLGTLRAREAVDDLIAALKRDNSRSFKRTVIEALGEIGDPRAEPLLLSMATEDADENIRFVAVNALATVGSSATIPVLEERLQREPVDAVKARIRVTLEVLRRKAR